MGLSDLLGRVGDALAALLRPETTDPVDAVAFYLPLEERALLSLTALEMVAEGQGGLVDEIDIRGVADIMARDGQESDSLVLFLHKTAIHGG